MAGSNLAGNSGTAGKRCYPPALQQMVEGHGRCLQSWRQEQRVESKCLGRWKYRSVFTTFFLFPFFSFLLAFFLSPLATFPSNWCVRIHLLYHQPTPWPRAGGVFVVLLCGLAMAIVVAILEFCWNSKRNAQQEKVTNNCRSMNQYLFHQRNSLL